MKTPHDPRHLKRVKYMKRLFSLGFSPKKPKGEVLQIVEQLPIIDAHISAAALEWPLAKIAKIDLAILRLACYELMIAKKEPAKVIIDEAIELAKEFGNDASSAFVNGVLGTVLKKTQASNTSAMYDI